MATGMVVAAATRVLWAKLTGGDMEQAGAPALKEYSDLFIRPAVEADLALMAGVGAGQAVKAGAKSATRLADGLDPKTGTAFAKACDAVQRGAPVVGALAGVAAALYSLSRSDHQGAIEYYRNLRFLGLVVPGAHSPAGNFTSVNP